jgi:hypothetical protein
MRKWWWWVPGCRKKWKLERRRVETLSAITGERVAVEAVAQRPRTADDVLDNALLETVLKHLAKLRRTPDKRASSAILMTWPLTQKYRGNSERISVQWTRYKPKVSW